MREASAAPGYRPPTTDPRLPHTPRSLRTPTRRGPGCLDGLTSPTPCPDESRLNRTLTHEGHLAEVSPRRGGRAWSGEGKRLAQASRKAGIRGPTFRRTDLGNGLEAARKRGNVGGRPRVIDDDKRAVILARREKGESIRVIARALDVSSGTVHAELTSEMSHE